MQISSATPYLILNGRARQAIALYESALGAKVETLQRFADVDKSCSEAMAENVMHASLRMGGAVIMLSDGPGTGPLPGAGGVSVALDFGAEVDARSAFADLSKKGTVVEPLFSAPWGALFGVVCDEFGISWMFNCQL